MKIEFDFSEPTVEQVADAIAQRVMGRRSQEYLDDESPPPWSSKDLGQALHDMLEEKIEAMATKLVTDQFDATIAAKIDQTVRDVVAAGWQRTDSYGSACGERLDLKARINELLTKPSSQEYGKPAETVIARVARDLIDTTMRGEFGKEILAAREKFKAELDAVVVAKFGETVRAALGIR